MCFSLGWIESALIWLVIICAVVALLKLVIPFALSQAGVAGGTVMQAINIAFWAFICIVVIIFIFTLISCLLGAGGGGFPFFHR